MIVHLVNGKTAVYGLIGNPVAHSLSPYIQNTLSKATGQNNVYATFKVDSASELATAVKGAHSLGIKGLNITVPYKKDVIPYLDEVDEKALQIGAVNTLVYTENGYKGYNTDVPGIIRAFDKNGIDLKNKPVLIIGAGGAAYAAAFGAAGCGASRLYIANRTYENAEILAKRIKSYYNITVEAISFLDAAKIDEGYFIIQTTSVGMDSELSPIEDTRLIERSEGVLDIIYSPLRTKILQEAEMLGKTATNGIDMLIYQAVCAFEIWNNIKLSEKCITAVSESIALSFVKT